MATDKNSKKSAGKSTQVEVRDLKPSRDAKGGGRRQEASFLPADDPGQTNAQKKEVDEV
ncbi:MAG TPA: hypothetical protein VF683_09400 [Chthoniobacterales bacterium]